MMARSHRLWLVSIAFTLTGCPPGALVPGRRPVAPARVKSLGPTTTRVALRLGDGAVDRQGVPLQGDAGQVPIDCRNGALTLQLDRPAPEGGVEVELASSDERMIAVRRVRVPEGRASIPLAVSPRRVGRAQIAARVAGQPCDLTFGPGARRACPQAGVEVSASRGSACAPCAAEAPRVLDNGADEIEWVCARSDFYVEARLGARTPCRDFRARLIDALKAPPGHRPLDEAVCAWGANGCERPCDGNTPVLGPERGVRIEVESVLADRPEDPVGHLRFYRVRYLVGGGDDWQRVEIDADQVCDAVDRLREAVATVTQQMTAAAANQAAECALEDPVRACGADGPESADFAFNVGQECPVRASHVGAVATDDMKRWHLRRMNGRRTPGGGRPAQAAAGAVARVALIDSGLHRGVRGGTLQVDEASGRFADDGVDPGFHGSAMALLMRGLQPDLPIRSLRIIDAEGMSTTADLARALEHALYTMAGRAPLVVNLSLGWPGEFSLPWFPQGTHRAIGRGGVWRESACMTIDDGVGEAVRYMLVRARELEAAGQPISVVAAAGNVPPMAAGDPGLDQRQTALRGMNCENQRARMGVVRGQNFDRMQRWLRREPQAIDRSESSWCRQAKARGPLPYLPAGWALGEALTTPTVGPGKQPYYNRQTRACSTAPLAIPVGAVNGRARLVYTPDEDFRPTLVAPGQQVYVDTDALPDVAPNTCGTTTPSQTMPMAFTGTSVSTALMAGAVARIHTAWAALTAGRGVRGRRPTRSPPLTQAQITTLLELSGVPVPDGGGARRPSMCRLEAMLASDGCLAALRCTAVNRRDPSCRGVAAPRRACNLNACAADDDDAAPWPSTYSPPECAPLTAASTWRPWQGACAGGACLSGLESGHVGPQPWVPPCPDCRVDIKTGAWRGDIFVELGTYLPASRVLKNPRVVIKVAGVAKSLTLTSGAPMGPGWSSKASLDVSSLSTSAAAWKAASAWLLIDVIDTKTGAKGTAYDPLALMLHP